MSLSVRPLDALARAILEGVTVSLEEGDLYAEPAPSPSLAAAIREHRAEIIDYLSRPEPQKPAPSWRWVGDSWWEDPATGHLHWCEE